MTEDKWLTENKGDDLLDLVADHLTPRQWVLLAAGVVRRVWDLLPDGPPRDAVDAAERDAGAMSAADREAWRQQVQLFTARAAAVAETAHREIVRSCDPDAADVTAPVLDRPNREAPAFALFQAASTNARNAITWTGDAARLAAGAAAGLFDEPSAEAFEEVRRKVDQAAEARAEASRYTNLALRYKHEGDEAADRAAGAKNKRLEAAKAEEFVRRLDESSGAAAGDAEEKRDRAARKHLARLVRELVGNPFKPPRFDPAWRTSTVLEVARVIDAERAFDKLPILADALLDADCDEEAVLRHLRGTEKDVKEQAQHVRGCWAVELILGRWQPVPPPAPGARPRRRRVDPDFGWDDGGDDTALA
jgi:hypothetical protein